MVRHPLSRAAAGVGPNGWVLRRDRVAEGLFAYIGVHQPAAGAERTALGTAWRGDAPSGGDLAADLTYPTQRTEPLVEQVDALVRTGPRGGAMRISRSVTAR